MHLRSSEATMNCFSFVFLGVIMAFVVLTAAEECALICPMIYAPVCATDGDTTQTFSSACGLNVYNCQHSENPLRLLRSGACDSDDSNVDS
ncbi:PI-actitoxin-Avd5a-like [Zootermopsis nevadensis]|uniref:Kazal-like domain-containing protein n=1 Tax=Zootermopsis nevadensis TaxID=136037 RepID=A0A067QJX0_ZOONE|nr:PI-actitoxin-Avd5a-like [Zootermopsis nevadensis]KDR07983.1 hypothetical protein L798_02435 [Zootermopsis nevadensis]